MCLRGNALLLLRRLGGIARRCRIFFVIRFQSVGERLLGRWLLSFALPIWFDYFGFEPNARNACRIIGLGFAQHLRSVLPVGLQSHESKKVFEFKLKRYSNAPNANNSDIGQRSFSVFGVVIRHCIDNSQVLLTVHLVLVVLIHQFGNGLQQQLLVNHSLHTELSDSP